MFADRTVTAMVPATDFERGKRWYAEMLDLKPTSDMGEGGAGYTLGEGTRFFLYATQYAGTAKHTVISIDSTDLAADMKALRDKGVVFEEYDFPDFKTVDGVAEFGSVKNACSRIPKAT